MRLLKRTYIHMCVHMLGRILYRRNFTGRQMGSQKMIIKIKLEKQMDGHGGIENERGKGVEKDIWGRTGER